MMLGMLQGTGQEGAVATGRWCTASGMLSLAVHIGDVLADLRLEPEAHVRLAALKVILARSNKRAAWQGSEACLCAREPCCLPKGMRRIKQDIGAEANQGAFPQAWPA